MANKQRIIAIIPPTVSIEASRIVYAAIREQQKTESLNYQREIYSWMLKRNTQGKINKEIKEIETTNVKLKRAGYPENPLTTAELCEVLDVDGIMTSNFSLSKPMSEEGAICLVLSGFGWGARTNALHAILSISDCENKKLIWNYEREVSGGLARSPSNLMNRLMRKASRKMPYIID